MEKIFLDTKKSILLIALLSAFEVIFQFLMQIGKGFTSYYVYIMNPQIVLMNFFPIFLIMLLLYFITNRVNLSFVIFSTLFDVLLIINHYKIYYRDEPLKPVDFMLGRETTNMLETYKLEFNLKIVVLTLILIITAFLLMRYIKNKKTDWRRRFLYVIITVCFMAAGYKFVYKSKNIYEKISWVPDVFNETSTVTYKGFIYSFINSFSNIRYEKPENYSEKYAKSILEPYAANEESEEMIPNVIAIMSESFFDPQSATKIQFHEGKNPLDDFNELKKEGYYGNIVVPGFGGATAYTEFEFLSGINISLIDRNMPSPYNTLINKKLYALPYYFKEKGFVTSAIHPGEKWFYNRNLVYQHMGFERTTFLTDLPYVTKKINNYTTDEETAKIIIEDYNKHLKENPDKGYFNFTVTIQNHGPYINYVTEREERIVRNGEVSDELFNTVNNYMDGLSDADDLLRQVKDFTETIDKPTVIIFFGDHLPYFDPEQKGYDFIGYDVNSQGVEALNRKQSVPYIICSNTAFKKQFMEQGKEVLQGEGDNISSNYLITELFKYMGVQMPSYIKYLEEMKGKVIIV